MKQIDQKINEYKNGDLEKRLNLFLTYRSLRPEYDEIEKNELDEAKSIKKKNRKKIRAKLKSEDSVIVPVMDA